MPKPHRVPRPLPAALIVALALASAPVASAATSFQRLPGFKSPGTPAKYNRVGVIKVGPSKAPNVLVLNPGTSASAAYFVPLANTVVKQAKGWQVWSVERRENLLEDHSQADRAKAGTGTAKELFDYYLGYIGHPEVTKHFVGIPNEQVQFAKRWGMRTEIEDLRRVVSAAAKGGRRVVVGGHSLGGSITAAYATWDFHGTPGPAAFGPRLHRRRQQSRADHDAGSSEGARRPQRRLAVADLRWATGAVRRSLQRGRRRPR